MNRRVLLIDADPAFRDTLTKELGRYRVVVMCEPEADRALQLGVADPPDLVVIGVEEPEKAGFRAFQKAKKGALGKTPIVLVTSSVPPDSFAKHKGLKVHADEYIDKRSMTNEELIAKIDNLIGLGDLQEDELGVAVDDDIPMELADGDVVLDETVGEEEEPDQFNERTVGPGTGVRADSMIAAETDAAFDALMGDEPSAIAAPVAVAEEDSAVPEPLPHPSAPEPVEDEISAVPEPVPHPTRPDSDVYPAHEDKAEDKDFAEEEPVAQVAEDRIEAPDRMQSQPAIPIDDEELVPMEDELPVEAAPEPAKPAEESTVAREPVVAEGARKSAMHAVVDLGLDAIAQDADREQSGVYDRKALRKISDLERQITQLKQELERSRAQADTAAKGGGREAQFLKLREQLDAKDKELKQTKNELVTIGGKVAELEKKLEQAQHTKDKLDTKNKELEQRIFESGDRTKELEASGQESSALAARLQHALDAKTKELEEAEAAHAEELKTLREELAENYATAGEDAVRGAVADSDKKHQKDIINLKAEQAGELKRVRSELGGEIERLKAKVEELTKSHASEIAQLVQKHEAELEARHEEHQEAQERDAQSHGQALSQLKQELDHARAAHEAAVAEAKGELEEVVAQHEEHKTQLHEQHRGELAAAAQKHAQELAGLKAQHDQALQTQAAQHAEALEAQAAEHAEALSASRTERDELFEAAERAAEAHRAALAEANASHTSQLAETRENAAREAAEQRAQIAAAKRHAEETAARAEQEREALEQEHAQQLAEQEARHERAIAVANGDFLKQKSVADAEHAKAIAALKAEADRKIAELEAEKEELRRGLSGSRETLKRTESELQSAMETIAERNDELRAHQAAIAERDTRIADLRKEIDGLLQENTSYQDQVLRAYQKIKSDEAMVARARKAMAIALTVLDDDGNPAQS